MAEPTGFWVGDDGVVAGDPEPADGVVMQHEWQWRESLTPHERVLAAYGMRSKADIAEDRQRRERDAALQQKAEDQWALVQLGLAPPPPTLADRFAQWQAEAEDEEHTDDARRARRAEDQLAARAERIAELEAQLAAERGAHTRTSQNYHRAVEGWGRARQQAAEQGYQRPQQYFRSGGNIVRGPY